MVVHQTNSFRRQHMQTSALPYLGSEYQRQSSPGAAARDED